METQESPAAGSGVAPGGEAPPAMAASREHPPVEIEVLRIALAAAEAERAAVVAELDQERAALAEVRAEREALTTALKQTQTDRDTLSGQLAVGVERYRAAVLRTAPDVPEELVAGASIEEVDRSLATARDTVVAVQRRLAERAASERVPAGSPARGGTDISALSAREKIALALAGR